MLNVEGDGNRVECGELKVMRGSYGKPVRETNGEGDVELSEKDNMRKDCGVLKENPGGRREVLERRLHANPKRPKWWKILLGVGVDGMERMRSRSGTLWVPGVGYRVSSDSEGDQWNVVADTEGKGSLSAALNVMVAVARPLLPRLARLCTLAWCEAYVPRDELSEQEAEADEQVESGEEGEKRGKRRGEKWTTSDREQSAKKQYL
jgi:hypothetical protein